ncbi:MAG TPA: sigma factor, partial [Ktedonobacterales bacterium]|nr:sigma factor [Ktedonobacterales bacterium]
MNCDVGSSAPSGGQGMTPGTSGTPAPAATSATPPTEDQMLLAALRRGDEAAFATVVNRYQPALQRLALTYVHDAAVAQEVVQDTWLGVLKGIDTFEARASLKTWIFRILINRAKTSAAREGRQIPFSEAWDATEDADEPAMDPDRFQPAESTGWPGWWASPPRAWSASPEEVLLAAET